MALPRQVTNGAELAEALQDVGRNLGLSVRPYTVTPRAPLASYVAAMVRTGVLVARHGPLLANAAFLPPGGLRAVPSSRPAGSAPHNCQLHTDPHGGAVCTVSEPQCAARERHAALRLLTTPLMWWGNGAGPCLRHWWHRPQSLNHVSDLQTEPSRRGADGACARLCTPSARSQGRTLHVTCTPHPGTGAVVLELLPYNWEWKGISQLYFNITRSLGDVHHFAWRAGSPRWAIFSEGEERYASWTAQECNSRWPMPLHAYSWVLSVYIYTCTWLLCVLRLCCR